MTYQSIRNLENSRILAGVGSVLTAIGFLLPLRGAIGIVALVGIILTLIGLKGLADEYKEPAIYRKALNGFILTIIGVVVAIGAFTALLSTFFFGLMRARPFISLASLFLLVIALIVVFILLILSSIQIKRAFDILAEKSGEGILRTGALLMLIGAVLTIILIGFFLLFVAWIIIAVGLFSLRAPAVSTERFVPPTMQSSNQVKYCSYCGAENSLESTYCTHCGRKLNA